MAARDRIRVFLDSNVIFSGLYSGQGPPGAVLEQAVEGRFSMIVSRQVLDEVVRTVSGRLPEALPSLRELLVNMPLEVCGDPDPSAVEAWSQLVGADDAPIAAAASAAEVDFLVSGDSHFLEAAAAAERKGLRIVSPTAFIAQIQT